MADGASDAQHDERTGLTLTDPHSTQLFNWMITMKPSSHLEPDTQELRDYLEFCEAKPISLMTYALYKLTPDLAIAVAKLFWPDFVLFEDGVFLAEGFNRRYFRQWKRELHGDMAAIERVMNHQHVSDLLINTAYPLGPGNTAYFGSMLMRTWKCALETQFPDRHFEVEGELEEESDDFIFTFWQTTDGEDT